MRRPAVLKPSSVGRDDRMLVILRGPSVDVRDAGCRRHSARALRVHALGGELEAGDEDDRGRTGFSGYRDALIGAMLSGAVLTVPEPHRHPGAVGVVAGQYRHHVLTGHDR